MPDRLAVKVWGDFACFTRPEAKVERMSYPVMTPTAAAGVLEAIFWKPEVSWVVHEIEVLEPITFMSLMRNEVTQRASTRVDHIDVSASRTQRHAAVLRGPAYVIRASLLLRSQATDDIAKYRDQFRRRVERGQCGHRPYLGCREFAAFFVPPDGSERPIDDSFDLGPMVYDAVYNSKTGSRTLQRTFAARLEGGRVRVPVPGAV